MLTSGQADGGAPSTVAVRSRTENATQQTAGLAQDAGTPDRRHGASDSRQEADEGGSVITSSSSRGLTLPAWVRDPITKLLVICGNRNVLCVLVFCFIDGGAHSIWSAQVFPVVIKSIGGNTAVGWMSAASGISQMAVAAVAGFAGEQLLRQTLLRIGACCGFIAALLTLGGVAKLQLWIFYVSQVFWGSYSGITATATEAIFADSVATGRRAFIYNVKWMDQTMSSVIGIVIAIVLLVSMGNEWELSSMRITMVGGLLLHPVAMMVLFLMKDKYSLNEVENNDGGAWPMTDSAGTGGGDSSSSCANGGSAAPDKGSRRGSVCAGEAEIAAITPVLLPKLISPGISSSSSPTGVQSASPTKAAAAAATTTNALSGAAAAASAWDGRRGYGGMPSSSSQRQLMGSGAHDDELQEEDPRHGSDSDDASGDNVRVRVDAACSKGDAESATGAAPSASARDGAGADPRLRGRLPIGCGEKNMVRYLNMIGEREHEAFLREQAELRGHPLDRVCSAWRYYTRVVFTWTAVPYLVCLVDFLVAFGSGMTMRYLPLYFIEMKEATPATLMTATLIVCPVQMLFSQGVQVAGTRVIGRIAATIIVRLFGTVLMLIMGLTDLPLWALLPIFIVRNAAMNCTRGITRSVIMDAVKKENRAKWSAFESFSSFTWAGSAVIGGYIAGAKGYQFSFTVTACFHFAALAVLVPAASGSALVESELRRTAQEKAREKKAQQPRHAAAEEVVVVSP